jgi:hypothetical protein
MRGTTLLEIIVYCAGVSLLVLVMAPLCSLLVDSASQATAGSSMVFQEIDTAASQDLRIHMLP